MSYRLPKLNGLRAFEAAARHGSYVEAAAELGVTAGAVSQQVKALEAALNARLFRRLHRGLVLTATGEAYLPAISAAFRAISDATENVAPSLHGRKLRFAVSKDVAALLPTGWMEEHGLTSAVSKSRETPSIEALETGKLEVIVRHGALSNSGLAVEQLGKDTNGAIILACKPGIAGCSQHRVLVKALREAISEDRAPQSS